LAVERKLIREHKKRVAVREFLHRETERAGFGGAEISRTPMGTRIQLVTERPGFVIGRRGETIKKLTKSLNERFGLDNPQIEVAEAADPSLNPQIMAQKLAEAMERGWHFRRAGHSTLRRVMESGAKGCLITIAGKLTGGRKRTEKFLDGHIKWCGDTAIQFMETGYATAKKKLGIIGCTVSIMRPDARLPDEVEIHGGVNGAATKAAAPARPAGQTAQQPAAQPAAAGARRVGEAPRGRDHGPRRHRPEEGRRPPRRRFPEPRGPRGGLARRHRGGGRHRPEACHEDQGRAQEAPEVMTNEDEGTAQPLHGRARGQAQRGPHRAHERSRRRRDGRRSPQPRRDPRPADQDRAHPDHPA
jgi:small subunit ribosomal protein S3